MRPLSISTTWALIAGSILIPHAACYQYDSQPKLQTRQFTPGKIPAQSGTCAVFIHQYRRHDCTLPDENDELSATVEVRDPQGVRIPSLSRNNMVASVANPLVIEDPSVLGDAHIKVYGQLFYQQNPHDVKPLAAKLEGFGKNSAYERASERMWTETRVLYRQQDYNTKNAMGDDGLGFGIVTLWHNSTMYEEAGKVLGMRSLSMVMSRLGRVGIGAMRMNW